MKIDGKQISQNILDNLRIEVEKLKKKNIIPHLAIIIVGENPSSLAYVRQKELKAKSIGVETTTVHLAKNISETDLIKTIQQYNNNNNVNGIIVQQPLPQNINTQTVTQSIDPKKDVDGFHANSCFEMPIGIAILEILKTISKISLEEFIKNKNIVVIGKGETGGKPIAKALEKLGVKPSIVDSRTNNPELITKHADIIISAVGKSNIIKPKMIKEGAILIGVGQHKENKKVIGDYDEEKIKDIVSFYTPTPGGVGPVDVTMLLKNLIAAAKG